MSVQLNPALAAGGSTSDASFIGIPVRAAFNAGICALAAHTFSVVTPGAAAVFGAASSLARNGLRCAIQNDTDGFVNSMFKSSMIYAAGAGAGALATKAVAATISFGAAVGLTGLMYVTSCAITALALGCICCTALTALLYGTSKADDSDKGLDIAMKA